MRVGVTGAGGLVAATLVPLWRRAGAEVVAWPRAALDVTDRAAVAASIAGLEPDVVVHLAGYTQVDRAEAEPEAALRVNRDGTAHVAAACARAGALMAYLSTDYVFGTGAARPIPPEAPATPRGAYAASKAAGEAAVRAAGGDDWLVVRSGWLYGPGGENFVDVMRAAAAGRRSVRVVDDQRGAPTSTQLLAESLWSLVKGGARGTWHVAAAGEASWWEVARAVFAAADAPPDLVERCTTAAAARAAPRPAYSVLDTAATAKRLGVVPPAWEVHVRSYVRTGATPGIGILEGTA